MRRTAAGGHGVKAGLFFFTIDGASAFTLLSPEAFFYVGIQTQRIGPTSIRSSHFVTL